VVTLVGLVTIALSVYAITWSQPLFAALEPRLGALSRRDPPREADAAGNRAEGRAHDYVVFGLGRYGSRIGQDLSNRGFRVLGVDFDPQAVAAWRARGLDAVFGDATDPEFAAHMNLDGTRAVVSAVPRDRGPLTSADPQLALLHGLRSAGFRGRIVLSATLEEDAAHLRAQGADMVLSPFDDAASFAVERLLPAGPD
jgi:Trk K+ transport system NAD-binding subunit